MPTIFIANMAIPVPIRFAEGNVLGPNAADVLSRLHHNRLTAKLRHMWSRGELAAEEVQSKAYELAAMELSPHLTADDMGEDDPILNEALGIARDLIINRMAQQGMLPPKNLDIHAKALVDGMPEIQEQARKRIEARFAIAAAALGGSV